MLTKPLTIALMVGVFILQIVLLTKLQLFGDEAFYWLEGKHLALSYSELPGWTAWMIRLGTSIFGNNYFAVRLFSYLAFLSLFYCLYLFNINRNLTSSSSLLIAIPLFMLISIMALPDIWLIFFAMWLSYFIKRAITTPNKCYWIIIGVLIALSLNVHVRMWIWLFFAILTFLFYFKDKSILKPIFFIVMPLASLGLIPIVLFNYSNDYALFSFQFGRRNPWQFQLSNISFVLSQFLVITPIVLFVWFKSLTKLIRFDKFTKWLLLTAFFHWLFYAIMSLFADGLRTTVHWVLISYIPVLTFSIIILKDSTKLLNLARLTGGLSTLILLGYLAMTKGGNNTIANRILDNSLGWKQIAATVKDTQQAYDLPYIIADYFMTGAELSFELKQNKNLLVLEHPKNIKHGRQKQLEIMGMLLKNPQEFKHSALLVVEDSTLKLKNKGKYYAKQCQNFKQMHFLKSLNIDNSPKKFNLFLVANTENEPALCEIPPLFYIQHELNQNKLTISGWVIFHQVGIKSVSLITDTEEQLIKDFHLENTGIALQFPEIKDPNLPNNGFSISLNYNSIKQKYFTIRTITNNNISYSSQIYYIQ